MGTPTNIVINFTSVRLNIFLGAQKNILIESALLSNNNICFGSDISYHNRIFD